jgi:hypothetical protein
LARGGGVEIEKERQGVREGGDSGRQNIVFLLFVHEFALMAPQIRTKKKTPRFLHVCPHHPPPPHLNSAHSSTAGVTEFLSPSVAGFLLQKELDYLGGAVLYLYNIYIYAPSIYVYTHTHTHTHMRVG